LHDGALALRHRLTSILLLVTFLGLGTGVLAYLHERQHAAEDAAEERADRAAGLPAERHHHDESNCHVCAQLHLPLIAARWSPPVMSLGQQVAMVPVVVPQLVERRPPGRADCRDPPGALVG
jgi:hypothetical protein